MRLSSPTLLTLLCVALCGCGKPPAKLPADSELKTMARESLLAFNTAIQAKDFTGFHQQVSTLWQKQITPEQLKTIFKSFIDQEIDLASIAQVDPIFEGPAVIGDDGVLVVKGRYPTTPLAVAFQLKYVQEKTAWKLFGIKVDAKPAGEAARKIPSQKEAEALVLESLLGFNQAILAKDFTAFYQQIAAVWRQQTTAEKLQANFQSFIDKGVDISPIAKFAPVFDPAPAINENGLLELKGHYPTRPNQMSFDLGYIYEAPAWKLIKVKVNLAAEDEEEAEHKE